MQRINNNNERINVNASIETNVDQSPSTPKRSRISARASVSNLKSVTIDSDLKNVFKLSNICTLKSSATFNLWRRQVITFLQIHNLYDYINEEHPVDGNNEVVLSILVKTVTGKYQDLIRNSITAFEAFSSLTQEIQGEKEQHITILFYQLTHVQYVSLLDYIQKFRRCANEIYNLDNRVSQFILILAFKSCMPRIGKQYVCLKDTKEISSTLADYISSLVQLIPKHILHKPTKKNKLELKNKFHSDKTNTHTSNYNKKKFKHPHSKQSANINQTELVTNNTENIETFQSGSSTILATHDAYINTLCTSKNGDENTDWILDGGANQHLCGNSKLLTNITTLAHPVQVYGVNKQLIGTAHKAGNLKLQFKSKSFNIDMIPIVEGCQNILSTPLLSKMGLTSIISPNDLFSLHYGSITLYVIKADSRGLYIYNNKECVINPSLPVPQSLLWHYRLGHPSANTSKSLLLHNKIHSQCAQFCVPCIQGKFARTKIPKIAKHRRGKAMCPLQRIHVDSVGPIRIESAGYKYFMNMVDEFTDYRWIFGFANKQVSADILLATLKRIQNTTNYRIKFFHCDNGTEILPQRVRDYFDSTGILLEGSVSYTPEQNGKAERNNRSVQDTARTMLIASRLPPVYWFYAVSYAVYVLNRLPSYRTSTVPYETLYGRSVDLSFIRIFGSRVECRIPMDATKRSKFYPKTMSGVFLGFVPNKRAYLVWIPFWNKFKAVRSVKFFEDRLIKDILVYGNTTTPELDLLFQPPLIMSYINTVRIMKRIRYFDSTRTPQSFSCLEFYSPEIQVKWKEAYCKEIDSITKAGDMSVVPIPPRQKLIRLRELFNIKVDNINQQVKYKVRFCARGDLLQYSDPTYAPVIRLEIIRLMFLLLAPYPNTYLLQADISTAFLNVRDSNRRYYALPKGHASNNGQNCWSGFCALYGLKTSPRSWNTCFHNFLASLHFKTFLTDPCLYGKGSGSSNKWDIFVKLYVDDMIVYSSSKQVLDRFASQLQSRFSIRSTSDVTEFLGLQLSRDNSSLFLHCRNKIEQLAQQFEITLDDCKYVNIPMLPKTRLVQPESELFQPIRLYQSIIGSLTWIGMWARPDIITYVTKLSQFQAAPRLNHV